MMTAGRWTRRSTTTTPRARGRPRARTTRSWMRVAGPSGPTPVVLAVGDSGFASNLASALRVRFGQVSAMRHGDGEFSMGPMQPWGSALVLVTQMTPETVHERLRQAVLVLDGAQTAGFGKTIVLLPRLPYGRGDKPEPGGASVPVRALARVIEAVGASAIVTANLHGAAIPGVLRIPLWEVDLLPALIAEATDQTPGTWVAIASDAGRARAAAHVAAQLGMQCGFLVKTRDGPCVRTSAFVGPSSDGASCLLLDDEVCTGSTLQAGAEFLASRGASRVRAVAVHNLLTEARVADLKRGPIERLVVSDTVPPVGSDSWLEVVPVAEDFAQAVARIYPVSRHKGCCGLDQDTLWTGRSS